MHTLLYPISTKMTMDARNINVTLKVKYETINEKDEV